MEDDNTNINNKDYSTKGSLGASYSGSEKYKSSWDYLEEIGYGIDWAWPNWLPRGFLTLLVSETGLGKSTLALRIAASFITGMDWLDGTPFTGETGEVIWCEAEYAHFVNLDRAVRWGLPKDKIFSPLKDVLDGFNLSNPEHRKALEYKLDSYAYNIKLVVIDSLRGATEGDENNSEMSKNLKYLAELAMNYNLPILMVHHLRKKAKGDSQETIEVDRIRGSSGIAQFARCIIALNVPNPASPDERKLHVIKNNLGRFPAPIGITITDHGIDTIPNVENWSENSPKSQREIAKAFLKEYLADGYKYSTDIYENGAAKGINKQTMYRAKQDLNIIAKKPDTKWVWELPQ